MLKRKIIAVAIAAAFALPFPGLAASDAEFAQIREQLKQMKEAYEKRIEALEKRLEAAEAKAGQAQASASKAESAAVQAAARPAGESAFNPGVSVILTGTYANLSQDPANYRIGGFIPGGEEIGPGRRGFSLAESELNVSANIDPYFRGNFIAALTPENEVEVEEAYIHTLNLGRGFTAKAGRFFSGIGYLNEIHLHAHDFSDFPLAYQAFLGRQLGDDGVQVKWLAPTETFLEFGAEAGRGRTFPGSNQNKNGAGLGSVFAHIGGDIGTSYAWRAGLSYLRTSPENRPYEDTDSAGTSVINSFSGKSRLSGADFILKWAPEGNPKYTNFKLQGEYFRRKETGTLTFDVDGASGVLAGPVTDTYSSTQSGWYLQGVYQFLPRWRIGLRHDELKSGTVNIGQVLNGTLTAADFPLLSAHDPKRNTLMFDYNPSEFSRIRLQFARDEARPGITDNQVFLQYIMSLGAHGAHKF